MDTRIVKLMFSALLPAAIFLTLGAVLPSTPALGATHTPSPRTTSSAPPNWPWHGVVMSHKTHADDQYTGTTPADLAAYYEAFGTNAGYYAAGLNSFHIYLGTQKYFNAKCPDSYNPYPGSCDADEAWTYTMNWLDDMLAECKTLGVTAIIGLNSVEKPDDGGYYPLNSESFWNSNVPQLYAQVTKLVAHLVSNDSSASYAYDILPEPTMVTAAGTRMQPTGWWQIQKNIIDGIQANDPGRWIVVKPGPDGGRYTYSQVTFPCNPYTGAAQFCPYSESGLVYSIHVYDPQNYTKQHVNGAYNEMGGPWPGIIKAPNGSTSYYDEDQVISDMHPVEGFIDHGDPPYYMYVGEFSAAIFACDSNVWLQNMVDIWENMMSPAWGWAYLSHGSYAGWSPHFTYTVDPPPPETAWPSITFSAPIPATETNTARWQDLQGMFRPSLYGYAPAEGACDPTINGGGQ